MFSRSRLQRLEKQREKNSSAAARKLQRKLTQPLDVSGQPGYVRAQRAARLIRISVELLSKQERKLCEEFHITPTQYALAKEALVTEYNLNEAVYVSAERARQLVPLGASA